MLNGILSLSLTSLLKPTFNPANAQTSSPCDNGPILKSTQTLPVILLHGYFENSRVWSEWENLLTQNKIPFCTLSFHPLNQDECGQALTHANELRQIIQQVKGLTGQNKVNIVAHSKGGLDARVYLNNTNNKDVANLIMIGTPNAGSTLALSNNLYAPAVFDIRPGAADTKTVENKNTRYFTIVGNWNPFIILCSAYLIDIAGYNYYFWFEGPDDGMVTIKSVESQPYFHNLNHTNYCHQDLLGNQEFNIVLPILIGRQ